MRIIDFNLFENYLGSSEYYEEMNRYKARKQRKEDELKSYLRSNDFKFDLITVKQQVRKRDGIWMNLKVHTIDEVHLKYFNRVFDALEKHCREQKGRIRYTQSSEGIYCYFIFESFKFERLIHPDSNGQCMKKIVYLD